MPRLKNLVIWVAILLAVWVSQSSANAAEKPARQVLIDVGGYRLNSVLLKPDHPVDLPPIVFIHGASTTLLDPIYSFRKSLEGKAELLFVDRPGHGRSDTGGIANTFPYGQADAIATLMDKRGIGKAIIVSHSFGGAVAAAFALNHPDKVIGLVFLSPAVYPWKGGIAWYNQAAALPLLGWVFSGLVVPPGGVLELDSATKSVFAPNRMPDDYISRTRAYRAIAPTAFHHNAQEIINLKIWARQASLRYPTIHAPTIIIVGDADQIVSPTIHADHLARDISGARLITVHNMGHKSDYVARELAIAAIYKLAGKSANLPKVIAKVEARISQD